MSPSQERVRPTDGLVVLSLSALSGLVLVYLDSVAQQPLSSYIERWGWRSEIDLSAENAFALSFRALVASFLHLGWLHWLGNVAFLLLLGPQLEKRIGHALTLVGFLLIAASANLAASWHFNGPSEPLVGASGAVAGVMGAYLVHHPNRQIGVYLPLGLYLHPVKLPGALLIGLWFLLQLGYAQLDENVTSPLSWRVHIGGFGFGLVFGFLTKSLNRR